MGPPGSDSHVGDPPAFVIVGGVNGSGKSTFAAKAAGTDLLLRQTAINPDTLSQQAEAEAKRRGLDLGNHDANIVGVERAETAAWKAVAEHRSAALETVLSTDKLVPLVRAASAREFRTRLVFVALPTVDLCIERVEVRVRQGGHAVPADRIRKRWRAAHDNLVRFLNLVDDVLVFANLDPVVPTLVFERVGVDGIAVLRDREILPEVTRRLVGRT